MIVNLQYLRAMAALMVVLYHVTDSAGRLGEVALPHFAVGFAGVDLFFVISGFIIWVTSRHPGSGRPARFLLRRALRVAPLYWLLTVALAATAVLFPALMGATVFDLPHFLASLAFFPAPHPTFEVYNPLLVVGWTLNYEMAFYALFAAVLLLPASLHFGASLTAIALLALMGFAFAPGGPAGFYTDPIILEFAAGIFIGKIYTDGVRLSFKGCLALTGAGFAGLAFAVPETRSISAGLPAAMIVAGAVFAEREAGPLRVPGLRLAGDASYSLYLVHLPALTVFQILYARLGPGAEGAMAYAYIASASLACVLAGVLCYALVERPLTALCRRALASPPLVPPLAGPDPAR